MQLKYYTNACIYYFKDIAEVDIADPDPNKTLVIIIKTFFLFEHLYFLL